MMVEDLTDDRDTIDRLDAIEDIIRGNEDLWNGAISHDELASLVLDGRFISIKKHDSLKGFIWESPLDLDIENVGLGYVYDYIVDNDIYLYEIRDIEDKFNGIVAIYR